DLPLPRRRALAHWGTWRGPRHVPHRPVAVVDLGDCEPGRWRDLRLGLARTIHSQPRAAAESVAVGHGTRTFPASLGARASGRVVRPAPGERRCLLPAHGLAAVPDLPADEPRRRYQRL